MKKKYHLVDRNGELLNEEGESEKAAVESIRSLRESGCDIAFPLTVVRRDRLSPENQAKITEFENAVSREMAKMMGKVA